MPSASRALTTQAIMFEAIPNQSFGTGPIQLVATSSSALAVTLVSNTSSVCMLSGRVLTLVAAGFCSVTASQPGNATYSSAAPVTRSFDVTAAVRVSGTLTVATGSPFAAGGNLNFMATGDFNGDGILDLAISDANDRVSVLLGDGSGGFTPAPGSPLGLGGGAATPDSVAVGDFNGDGIQDLVTANYESGNATVVLGNGSGGFAPAPGSPFGLGSGNVPGPVFVAVGDFNGDGNQDLVTANLQANDVTVLLGDGSGGFAPATASPLAVGGGPYAIAVGDFNRDGIQDFAVASKYAGNVAVFLGNSNGNLTAATGSPFAAGSGPDLLAVGDFNGDGVPDVAVGNAYDSSVAMLLGDGKGGLKAAPGSPFYLYYEPLAIAAGDFNGDGKLDLAVGGYNQDGVVVLLGDGSGGMAAAGTKPFTSFPTFLNFVAVGDFNGDGRLDLASTSTLNPNITVLLGESVSTISSLSTTSPPTISAGTDVPLTLKISDKVLAFSAPTGTATFFDGITPLGTASQNTSPYSFNATNLAAGSHTLNATYSGDGASLGSTSNSITVQVTGSLTPQQITFGPMNDQTLGAPPFVLTATASSGLSVTFASNTANVCLVAESMVTLVSVGTCSISATQTGNTTFAAGSPVTQSFVVHSGNGNGPAITPGGIGPVFSSSMTVQSGSWISIYGINFVTSPVTWTGNFPTNLGGVTVTIDGRNAYLWYVSPTQINLQVPDDNNVGLVSVTVTNANGNWTSTVTLGTVAPSFSLLGDTKKHVAGIILRSDGSGTQGGGTYDIIGPTGNSLGYPTVAATAGDNVELFGVGFGPTSPAFSAGQAVPAGTSGVATQPIQLVINGLTLTPSFSGITEAGLFQFNLTLPAGLGSGDVPLTAMVGGVQTPANVVIAVQ